MVLAMRRLAMAAIMIVFLSVGVHADDAPCSPESGQVKKVYFELKDSSRDTISNALKNLPNVRRYVMAMLEDPNVSANIKRIVRKALEDENTRVVELSRELRAELELPNTVDAFVSSKSRSFRFMTSEAFGKTANQALDDVSDGMKELAVTQRSKHLVFVPDKAVTDIENDVIVLIHELAHIRFDMFLEKNIDQLVKRFSWTLLRKAPDGKIEINQQLYDFLTERYALETEYEAFKEGRGRYFPEKSRHMQVGRGAKDSDVKNDISAKVIKDYGITDPGVLRFKDRTLKSILLGGVKP